MSQETFMQQMEEDAMKRKKDREMRNSQSGELNKKGNEAFKNDRLYKALDYYNQVPRSSVIGTYLIIL